jgi:hypothetical protein
MKSPIRMASMKKQNQSDSIARSIESDPEVCGSIPCVLWRVYFAPLKTSQNLKILFLMMILTLVIAAADYDFRPKMPSFVSLNVSPGIIDFSDKKATRGGAALVLMQAQAGAPS